MLRTHSCLLHTFQPDRTTLPKTYQESFRGKEGAEQEGKRGARDARSVGNPTHVEGARGEGDEDPATMASLGMIGVRIEK